jgi:DNA-binding LacI/PurR family transcriptional regulator
MKREPVPARPDAVRQRAAGGRHRATLADVARLAGVSLSTASRVLNGIGELSDETRRGVLDAAASLRFRPSRVAQSLRARRTLTVGFVVPDISSPFYVATLRAAQGVLEASGYHVVLMNSERNVDDETEALRTLEHYDVDGLLVATTGLSTAQFSAAVGEEMPCIFFDGVLDGVGDGSVRVENEVGIGLLVDHLVSHGHRRIALLVGPDTESSAIERIRGFRESNARHGIDYPESYLRRSEWTREQGYAETLALLDLTEPPTAVVAASDDLALGCLAACRERGVALPRALALVSFDDPYFGDLLEPPLTALASRSAEVGRLAAQLLIDAMGGEPREPRHLRVPVELILRRSCGCAGH